MLNSAEKTSAVGRNTKDDMVKCGEHRTVPGHRSAGQCSGDELGVLGDLRGKFFR